MVRASTMVGTIMDVLEFKNEFNFLSNFYPSPITCLLNNTGNGTHATLGVPPTPVIFPTVEAAYQAHKFPDLTIWLQIAAMPTPGQAKRFGKHLVLRPYWDHLKVPIMESLLRSKFADGLLRDQLLATKPGKLVEGNNWGDVFWGVCGNIGENQLGKLLMKIRDE